MKKNLILGFLGIAIILSNYLGFSYSIKSAVIIFFGLTVSFISFREIIKDKVFLRMKKNKEKIDGLQKKNEETFN